MSIKKIAEMTGSSPATVSHVLNHPDYKCATPGLREKIWKAAMELHYTPNEAARNLKRGTTASRKHYEIDILMTRMDGAHTDPFFEELLRAVESQIHENGCILSRVWYKAEFSDDKACRKMNLTDVVSSLVAEGETRSEGLIIIGRCNPEVLRKLHKRYKNIVSINRNSTNYEVDEILCDGEKIASMAVEYLIRLGHERIAYVGKCYAESRYQGYLNVLKKHELDVFSDYVVETGQTEKEAFLVMGQFMKMEEPPTAIYCANDISAIGMLKCLGQYKNPLYLPSIISSDGIEEGQCIRPMLTTVQLPKENMARFAMHLLLDRIERRHEEVVRMELSGQLLVRSSCTRVTEVSQPEYCI